MRELKTGKRLIAWIEMMPLDQLSVNTDVLWTATTFEDLVQV